MNNLTTVNQKQALATMSKLAAMLDTSKVDNINDAKIRINTAYAIQDKTKLPLCKLFSLVKNREYFKHDEKHNKNFEMWATNHYKLGKASVFKYAKAGDFVSENGFNTIFAQKNENDDIINDFEYSQLIRIVELCTVKDGKNIDEKATTENIEKVIENGIITFDMSVKDIEKALKYKPEKELLEQGETEQGETEQGETEQDKPETDYNPLNAIKETNIYKFSLSIFESALLQLFNDNANKDIFTVLEYMQNIAKGKKEQEQEQE